MTAIFLVERLQPGLSTEVQKSRGVGFRELEQLAAPVLDPQEESPDQVDSLVLSTAVAATLYKLVTDKLLALQLPKAEP